MELTMNNNCIPNKDLFFIRILIAIQLAAAIWVFIPIPYFSAIPEEYRDMERLTDKKIYEYIDLATVYMSYVKFFLCATLAWPRKITCILFFLTSIIIEIISSFDGVAISSEIDALINYVQMLASGIMLGILWVYGFFIFKHE